MITLVDYGLGNLFSVERAIKHIGGEVIITDAPETIIKANSLILPGVGAFGEGILNLRRKGLVEAIKTVALSGRPLLGICLGMQLLMTFSKELGVHQGLNLIEGKVVHLSDTRNASQHYKVPHIGWSELELPNENTTWANTILKELQAGDSAYFIHSYVVMPSNSANVLATTTYGGYKYCAVIKKDKIYGCQFHPEKSGPVGLQVLKNFLEEE